LTWGAIAALALLVPVGLWFVVPAVAFAAGSALERYRQARIPLPPTLADTPGAWWTTLTSEMDPGYLAGALVLLAGACTVLLLSFGGRSAMTTTTPSVSAPEAGQRPTITIRPERVGRDFTVSGATFRVIPSAGAGWAREIEAQNPGSGRRWMVLAVDVTNVSRAGFNPGLLTYQLSGPHGALYAPDRGGVVGPVSLGTRAGLAAGEGAEERLAFRVPGGSSPLRLLLNPTRNGDVQVRVPVPLPAG